MEIAGNSVAARVKAPPSFTSAPGHRNPTARRPHVPALRRSWYNLARTSTGAYVKSQPPSLFDLSRGPISASRVHRTFTSSAPVSPLPTPPVFAFPPPPRSVVHLLPSCVLLDRPPPHDLHPMCNSHHERAAVASPYFTTIASLSAVRRRLRATARLLPRRSVAQPHVAMIHRLRSADPLCMLPAAVSAPQPNV
ncbi:hypothetical protein HYPSUDRAFT_201404 [Hypholoma sublateritium FD-334 SS-4]|uniref:Uncharacterized protein n=1 Tax=Hypholoma sublateritium (strain FD-334 SS-4) TaxID=945553 RepID=A0A0D2PUV7_HYPSF|nr:hypothetical protein HYPSUDRAFT_201404 [Hypholoma sublateritium FD-334 SS-4]